MEEHMGCGYGACKGCVVPLRPASDTEQRVAQRHLLPGRPRLRRRGPGLEPDRLNPEVPA